MPQNKTKSVWPSVTVVTPTLNAASILKKCFAYVRDQDYPQDKIEIVVADGGSADDTRAVATSFGAVVIDNPLKTAEAGKAVGLRAAKNDYILLLDSDNFITEKDWLKRMMRPLMEDSSLIGSEPLYWTYRRSDGALTRYTAMLGMGDPLVLFTGYYDRYSILSGKWTRLPIPTADHGDWLKLTLLPKGVPTIGANGCIIKRDFLLSQPLGDYLFDVDVIALAVDKAPITFAKVKVGIVHVFGGDLKTFAKKQRRRIKDFLYYQKTGQRSYPWSDLNKWGLMWFVLYTILIIPVIGQAIIGYIKKPDWAWFLHPLACWITLWVYGTERIKAMWGKVEIADRTNWKQTK